MVTVILILTDLIDSLFGEDIPMYWQWDKGENCIYIYNHCDKGDAVYKWCENLIGNPKVISIQFVGV